MIYVNSQTAAVFPNSKFQHNWLDNKTYFFCEKSSTWWSVYVEDEGIYCLLCRKHDTLNKQNKNRKFNREPSTRFRTETFDDHYKTGQHQDAISTEMFQRVSIFQKEINEK